jgi:hypothetical protein
MIKSIYFSPEDGRLRLCLSSGEERVFTDVSVEAVTDLVEAPSPGHHYVQNFRHQQRRAA